MRDVSSVGRPRSAGSKEIGPKPLPPPIIQLDNIVIEDDASGNFLIIAPNSGEYKFHRCSDGLSMSGFGVVKLDGCAVSFEDNQPDHRVLASVNLCAQEGKAIVERFAPVLNTFATDPVKEILIDRSFRDNTLSCALKEVAKSSERIVVHIRALAARARCEHPEKPRKSRSGLACMREVSRRDNHEFALTNGSKD